MITKLTITKMCYKITITKLVLVNYCNKELCMYEEMHCIITILLNDYYENYNSIIKANIFCHEWPTTCTCIIVVLKLTEFSMVIKN